jgi:Leucine-rich repeat (LRR) protein
MKTLKLTLLFCLLTAFTYADISKTQKDALVAIYNATNGESWKQSWDLNQPVSAWYGLSIENDNVVAINLSFNNLNGKLPEDISVFKALRILNLSFNKLEGELPTTLTNISSLEDLKLFSNNFSGAIPKNIGNLTNLKFLEL